ncbi:unnamed protein product [Lactuca saligna]|uniref:Uncharacterized protein n=1 Tax=Lactuca saligna TaxID=75948 RepID=A0AA35Y9G8_LACSI|nr:unnamed protein product [Lactuca saligna]
MLKKNYYIQYMRSYTAEFVTKESSKVVKPWKLHVLVLELSSLLTEIAYRDGVMRRETLIANFVSRKVKWHIPDFYVKKLNLYIHAYSLSSIKDK